MTALLLLLGLLFIGLIVYMFYVNSSRISAATDAVSNLPCNSCGAPAKKCGCGKPKPQSGSCNQCGMPKPQCGCPMKKECSFC